MIPYLPPSTAITASHWTAIFQQADALMTSALSGLSAVLAGVDKQWDRSFFFFDPTNPPGGLHPLACKFLLSASFGPPTQPALFYRLYNDSSISTLLAGLSAGAPSSKFGVVKLTSPAWSAWEAAVYPGGFGSQSTTGLDVYNSGTYYAAVNCLDVSLQAWTMNISGVNYAVTFEDVTTAEHSQPWKPVDIYISSNFTWLAAWNKHKLVRLHNCNAGAVSVTFGTVTATVAAGASLTLRLQSSGLWTSCGNYFHWMESGDPRFLQCPEATGGAASILQPGIVADVLQSVLTQSISAGTSDLGGALDSSQFWNLNAIYNNPAYVPTTYEKTPPSGGYLPALGAADLLGDLIVHRGNILVVNRLIAPTRNQFTFAGFASLASVLGAAGVTSRPITQTVPAGAGGGTVTNLELYYSNGSNRQDLIDLSSPLITFITGGNPAAFCGASQSPGTGNPASLVLPWIQMYALAVAANPTTTNYTFYHWAVNGSGAPYQSSAATVTVNNAGSTATILPKVFLPTDTVSAVETWLAAHTGGNGISFGAASLLSTPFGPIITWTEIWPLNAQFPGIPSLTSTLTTTVIYEVGVGLIVTRARFLAAGFGVWPPTSASSVFMAWNFPRVDQRYIFQRFFLHATADAPLMPNWSGSFGGSNYATVKYISGYPWADALNTGEFVHVQSFYETTPIGADSSLACGFANTQDKTGISRMGAYAIGADNWPIFANWFNSLGNLSYPTAPDVTGGSASVAIVTSNNDLTDWYSLNNNHILPSATGSLALIGDNQPAWLNVLPCQVEHINLLASLINAQPPMKLSVTDLTPANTTFTFNFAASNILIVNGGTGYAVGDGIELSSLAINLKVSSVSTGGVVTGLAQNGTVGIGSYYATSAPLRPFATTTYSISGSGGAGSGLLIDTTVGQASSLSFLPAYAPIGVPLPTGGPITGTFWPRTAYFSWNGPSIAGAADPIGTYLANLWTAAGAPALTIQATLPDGFGPALPATDLFISPGSGSLVAGTASEGGYASGFTPAFAITAASYRWVSIADARNLYHALSVPFLLNGIYAPMTFTSALPTVNQTYSQVDNPNQSKDYELGCSTTPSPTVQAAYEVTPPGTCWQYPYVSPVTSVTAIEGGGILPGNAGQWGVLDGSYPFDIGVQVVLAGFYNSPAGNWLTTASATQLRNQLPPIIPPQPGIIAAQMLDTYVYRGSTWSSPLSFVGFSFTVHTRTITYTLDYGPLNRQINPFGQPAAYQALAWLLEGLPMQVAANLPQNYAAYDPAFVVANQPVYQALGTNVIPLIADNTVENDPAEITVLSGTGGAGQYDHTLTTGLANARLVTIPIDGQIGSAAVTGAGNNSGPVDQSISDYVAGAGGAGSAGGGSGGL